MNREQEKRRLRAGAFMVNNGRVLMTINLLREKYNALRSVEKGLKAEGIERQEFIDSVNFLHEEGYIYLRDMESYVTQETHLFHDSIANNIAIAKPGATREEIMEAAKKASIHDFIMTLPNGYDTEVGELGDTLSGGEKQRIGIARAFLHDASMILLDEPTSNLDSLNEGIILKSLKESAEEKTIVLVSHRVSTMNVADVVYEMENGRIS